jgi:hypothetical protein
VLLRSCGSVSNIRPVVGGQRSEHLQEFRIQRSSMDRRRTSIVDLTLSSGSSSFRRPPSADYVQVLSDSPPPRREYHATAHEATAPARGVKRRRLDDGDPFHAWPSSSSSFSSRIGASSQSQQRESADLSHIESVDLTEVNGSSALSKTLAKQREDAIKAQARSEDRTGRSILTAYKCPVCMDTLTDATSTVCG